MKQIEKISIDELSEMAENMYGNFVKAVVDIEKNILVVDAEMHVDMEQFLLEQNSEQNNLWGINLYPENYGKDNFVEFDSMINIRPRQNNPTRDVLDQNVRTTIKKIVSKKVTDD